MATQRAEEGESKEPRAGEMDESLAKPYIRIDRIKRTTNPSSIANRTAILALITEQYPLTPQA
jgi:hypothetical protein